ncbi:hypothetical protein ES703_93971 [subsurface metagenome]
MLVAHSYNSGEPADAVLDMHHIVTGRQLDEELVVGHGSSLHQTPLLDKAEDFGVGKEKRLPVHYPPLPQQPLH